MKMFHVTVNGKQHDIAASTIKTAISRGLERARLDSSTHVEVEANLSNWGEVYQYQFTPVRLASEEDHGYFLIDGKRYRSSRGGDGAVLTPSQAHERALALAGQPTPSCCHMSPKDCGGPLGTCSNCADRATHILVRGTKIVQRLYKIGTGEPS